MRRRPEPTGGTAPESRSARWRPRVCAAPSSRENHRPPVPSPPPQSRPPPRTDRRLPSCKRTRATVIVSWSRVRVRVVSGSGPYGTHEQHGPRCCSSRYDPAAHTIARPRFDSTRLGSRAAASPTRSPTPRRSRNTTVTGALAATAAAALTLPAVPAARPERARRHPSARAAVTVAAIEGALTSRTAFGRLVRFPRVAARSTEFQSRASRSRRLDVDLRYECVITSEMTRDTTTLALRI